MKGVNRKWEFCHAPAHDADRPQCAGACASPLPPVDPKQAWVDLYTMTPGRVIMADRLDGKRLDDGRYFQVTPGKHELVVRFDYEIYAGAS